MQKTRHWMMTIAALLCSIMVNAATYPDWTSTNKGQGDSTSSNTYTISAAAGDVLTFDWKVSSESGCDKLIVTVDGTEILNESGEASGTYQHTFDASGDYMMVVEYTKDGSVDNGEDCAKVFNIVYKEGNVNDSGDSSTGQIIASGVCGTDLTWELTDKGELVIGGTGTMNDYFYGGSPWYSKRASITKVTLRSDVTSIGNYAFYNCSNLQSITIPESVTSIGGSAFFSCSSLTSITIPEGVTSIGESAFVGSNFISINIPKNITEIKKETFRNCRALASISIPEGVTIIGNSAFECCESLTSITIPNSVVKIGSKAFWNYNNTPRLTSVTIGCGVKEIGEGAFGCYTLKNVIIEDLSAWCNIRFGNGTANPIYYAEKFYVGGELVKDLVIPDNVASISPYAFYYCKALSSITIPGTVSSIGDFAFCYSGVKNLCLNKGLTTIGKGAFQSTPLTSITIPEGVTTIDASAFSGSTNATSITLPSTLITVGEDAFRSLNSLERINISDMGTWCEINFANSYANPMSGLSSGDKIYLNDVSISELELPAGIKSIGNYAFYGAGDILGGYEAHLIIPDGVESIGDYAFSQFDQYYYITLPNSLSSIGTAAFSNCRFRSISLPENITSISPQLLMGCGSLKEVHLPNGITSIGDEAFYGCYGLTSITLPTSLTTLGKYVFRYCSNLTSIISMATTPPTCSSYETFLEISSDVNVAVCVPESSVSKYSNAFGWNLCKNFVAISLILDSQENYSRSEEQDYPLLTYTRTFNNTNWQSLYVPFDIDYNNIKNDFDVAYINDVHQFDDDNDGTIDRTQVEAIKITTGVLDANYPYLIRAKEVGEKVITMEDAVLYATEENSIDCSSVFRNYTFTGSYTTKTAVDLPASEGYYALTGGEWKQLSETAKLGAFRVYLKIDSRVAGEEVAEAISMRVVGEDGDEDDATGIDTSEFKSQNTELIYDLQGRRVERPTKGVYIVNGVKRVF